MPGMRARDVPALAMQCQGGYRHLAPGRRYEMAETARFVSREGDRRDKVVYGVCVMLLTVSCEVPPALCGMVRDRVARGGAVSESV